MAWKYIVLQVGSREVPVIFPSTMVHQHVAGSMKAMYAAEAQLLAGGTLPQKSLDVVVQEIKTVSAGEIGGLYVEGCGGHSSTLDLKSRGETDDELINTHPYLHGALP